MDHVSAVLATAVRVECNEVALRHKLLEAGAIASGANLDLPYDSEGDLARILSVLQELKVPFADEPGGWPPAAVFASLRERGLTLGSIVTVGWRGPSQSFKGVA